MPSSVARPWPALTAISEACNENGLEKTDPTATKGWAAYNLSKLSSANLRLV
jgi:hypothetical protein